MFVCHSEFFSSAFMNVVILYDLFLHIITDVYFKFQNFFIKNIVCANYFQGLLKFCLEATKDEDAPAIPDNPEDVLQSMDQQRRQWLEVRIFPTLYWSVCQSHSISPSPTLSPPPSHILSLSLSVRPYLTTRRLSSCPWINKEGSGWR